MAEKKQAPKSEVKTEDVKTEDVKIEDVQAMVAQMLAEARAQADEIIAKAKTAAGEAPEQTDEEKAAYEAYMNEEVEVKLFKDNDKYKDPVFVGVNGETIAIERGVRVKVKRKFAEVLDNSDKQDYETSKLIERKSDEFGKTGL